LNEAHLYIAELGFEAVRVWTPQHEEFSRLATLAK
jgi:hypothetical protein